MFLGHFQPQEGKPDLWELDSDYYLHVAGHGDECPRDNKKILQNSVTEVVSSQQNMTSSISAARQHHDDYHRMKLTSFDKLLQVTCGSLQNVRLYGQSVAKSRGLGLGNGIAPDAEEVQLKSPNWLFRQRKQEYSTPESADPVQHALPKRVEDVLEQEFSNLDWLSSYGLQAEEELYDKYLMQSSMEDSWYGTGLLPGSVEDSEANQHYQKCCKGPELESLDLDASEGKEFDSALTRITDAFDEETVKLSMESALNQLQNVDVDSSSIIPESAESIYFCSTPKFRS